jgi:hypothetical protein
MEKAYPDNSDQNHKETDGSLEFFHSRVLSRGMLGLNFWISDRLSILIIPCTVFNNMLIIYAGCYR